MKKKRFFIGCALACTLVATVFVVRQCWSVSMRAPLYRQKGASSATIVLTEFSDFQCPNCAKAQPTVKALLEKHKGEILLVFRHKPLPMHKWAFEAAQAAEAAGLQGRFWEYHDLLFGRQKDWASSQDPNPLFLEFAKQLDLNLPKFEADMEDERWIGLIQRDVDESYSRSINVTPTFFVNERRLVGDSQLLAYGEQFIELEKKGR